MPIGVDIWESEEEEEWKTNAWDFPIFLTFQSLSGFTFHQQSACTIYLYESEARKFRKSQNQRDMYFVANKTGIILWIQECVSPAVTKTAPYTCSL